MNSLLAMIDRMTSKIPPNVMRLVRLGAILVWAVLGTVVVFFSWRKGQDATPAQGQDLSIATIKERVQREENRRNSGDVTVPDLREFLPETNSPDMPGQKRPNRRAGLSGVDDRLIEPDNPIEKPSSLPPFIGEDSRNEAPLRVPETRPREEDKPRRPVNEFKDLSGKKDDLPPPRRQQTKPDLMPVE